MKEKLLTTHYKLQTRPGFTLMELMIVIAITGTLASITIGGFRDQAKIDSVKSSAREIAATIRKAETFTRTGVPFITTPIKGGYGVQLDATNNQYRLVWSVDSDPSVLIDQYHNTPTNDSPWQKLPNNVEFDTLLYNEIVFLPPKVVMAIKENNSSNKWHCSLTPYRSTWCDPTDLKCIGITKCDVDYVTSANIGVHYRTSPTLIKQIIKIDAISGKVSVE